MKRFFVCFFILVSGCWHAWSQSVIDVNQVAYDVQGPKSAIVRSDTPLRKDQSFVLVDKSGKVVFQALLKAAGSIQEWLRCKYLYKAYFSQMRMTGVYSATLKITGETITSAGFQIGQRDLAALSLSHGE